MEKLNLFWTSSDDVFRIIQLLKKNKIILGTSDTVFGLLAPLTAKGFDSLNSIKGRYEKPYLVLIGDREKVNLYAELPLSRSVQSLINKCWPGPLTLILNAKKNCPPFLQSKHGTIGLRMPDHLGLLSVLHDFDGLFSTSANKAGEPVPSSIDNVDSDVIRQCAAIVLDRPGHGNSSEVCPSTILNCTSDEIKVVREGAYAINELEEIAGAKFLT